MTHVLRRGCARIAEHEFWLLWVFGAPLLFARNLPPALFGAALATIPVFWLARKSARGQWSIATPLDLALGLLMGLGLVGVAVSNNRLLSLQMYGEFVGGIALYYGVVNGLSHAQLSKGVWLLLALGFAMGLVGLVGGREVGKLYALPGVYAALPKMDLTGLNPRGFAPNIVAGALAPLVPLTLAWAWTRARIARAFLLAGALGLLTIVFLTQSRGALLGIAVAFGLLSVWRFRRLLILVPFAVGALWWGGAQTLLEFVLASDASASAAGRLELWQRALLLLRDFPFTGIGLGAFETTVLTLYPLFQNAPGQPVPHAHNLFLQMGVDYGIGGLVAFVGLVVTVLLTGLEVLHASQNRKARWLAVGLLAGYSAYVTHSLLDAAALSTKVSVVVWLVVALLMVLRRGSSVERAAERAA